MFCLCLWFMAWPFVKWNQSFAPRSAWQSVNQQTPATPAQATVRFEAIKWRQSRHKSSFESSHLDSGTVATSCERESETTCRRKEKETMRKTQSKTQETPIKRKSKNVCGKSSNAAKEKRAKYIHKCVQCTQSNAVYGNRRWAVGVALYTDTQKENFSCRLLICWLSAHFSPWLMAETCNALHTVDVKSTCLKSC